MEDRNVELFNGLPLKELIAAETKMKDAAAAGGRGETCTPLSLFLANPAAKTRLACIITSKKKLDRCCKGLESAAKDGIHAFRKG